jgi:hypothetical protein
MSVLLVPQQLYPLLLRGADKGYQDFVLEMTTISYAKGSW